MINPLESLRQYVGKTGIVSFDGLKFQVRIEDTKVSYGNPRFLVSPVSGLGVVWIAASRVSFQDIQNSHSEQEKQQ